VRTEIVKIEYKVTQTLTAWQTETMLLPELRRLDSGRSMRLRIN
jgi:hypothetical protein